MLKINYFYSKPGRFRNREEIHYSYVKLVSINDNIFKFVVLNPIKRTSYSCSIYLDEDLNVKFHCDCESFKYQFSALLNSRGCLLYPDLFSRLNKLPVKNSIVYVCKHLEACIKFMRAKNLIDKTKNKRILNKEEE